jgi:hypothetical protein
LIKVKVPCVKNLGKFGTLTQNLPTPNETSTMACTQHIPKDNDFHDLHNGHVDFE